MGEFENFTAPQDTPAEALRGTIESAEALGKPLIFSWDLPPARVLHEGATWIYWNGTDYLSGNGALPEEQKRSEFPVDKLCRYFECRRLMEKGFRQKAARAAVAGQLLTPFTRLLIVDANGEGASPE